MTCPNKPHLLTVVWTVSSKPLCSNFSINAHAPLPSHCCLRFTMGLFSKLAHKLSKGPWRYWFVVLSGLMVFCLTLAEIGIFALNFAQTFTFSSALLSNREVSTIATRMRILFGVQFAAFFPNAVYFIIFWPRINRKYTRSCTSLGLWTIPLVLSSVNMSLGKALSRTSVDLDAVVGRHPELTIGSLTSAYSTWLDAEVLYVNQAFQVTVICGATQGIAVAFWLWFLPKRERLPNQYEPIVRSRKRWSRNNREPSTNSYELGSTDTGSLAAIFKKHEEQRSKERRSVSRVS